MSSLAPRFMITASDIDLVMARFYAAIRAHEVLGPIFAAHISQLARARGKNRRLLEKSDPS